MKRLFTRLIVTCVLFAPLSVIAAPEDGAGWLSAQQQADGGIYSPSDLALDQQSTSEVVRLFGESLPLTVDQSSSISFLQSRLNTDPGSQQTEFISRALLAGLSGTNGVRDKFIYS